MTPSQHQTPSPATSLARHLERHLQGAVLSALERDDVTDIHVNADGSVHLKTHGGYEGSEERLAPESIRAVLQLLADAQGDALEEGKGFLATRLPPEPPFSRGRLHAALPPVVSAPSFAIRVHAPEIFTVKDFVVSRADAERLQAAILVEPSPNVLIFGSTSTGKTSLVNVLLQQVASRFRRDRILCMEDVPEITVTSPNHLPLKTEGTPYDLEDLVANALRLDPDRLVVGEVRGPEALDLIDAWSTGHRGGFATLHAENASGALARLERLARRHRRSGHASLKEDIAAAVDLLIELRRTAKGPRIHALHRLANTVTAAGRYRLDPLT